MCLLVLFVWFVYHLLVKFSMITIFCYVLFLFVSMWLQTGADGCICHLEYDKNLQIAKFVGMKQVKELSLIESIGSKFSNDLGSCNYAAGFASTYFIIWNLAAETKVLLSFSFQLPTLANILSCSHRGFNCDRFFKFHVVDGGGHILTTLAMFLM